jgi:hypothetical protein
LFGRNKEKKNKNVTEEKEKPLYNAWIKYMGGHKAHPAPGDVQIFFYNDRIELGQSQEKTVLKIPYSKIINIENMDEKKISGDRVFMFGIYGALWKKRYIYTVIHYKDEIEEQKIVLDFEDYIDSTQRFIYNKMLEARKGDDVPKSAG